MVMILFAAALLSGQDAASATRSPSDLTRDLNSGPPFKPASAAATAPPVAAPAAAPPAVPRTPQAQSPVSPAPSPSPTRELNSAPPATASRPPLAAAPLPAPAAASAPAPRSASEPAVALPSTSAPVSPAPAPAPQGLDAAAIAALPFALNLPADAAMTRSRAGADGAVYTVRRAGVALVMIYTGPASQFPIYDGQMVQAGGRASVVVTEGARRLALEHLFQRASAPQEIHVWVAAPEGADRDLGERIAQSVDAR